MMILRKIQDKLLDSCYFFKSAYDKSPFGPDTQNYWVRRREFFPKFDSGIRTDAEGLYSVTPEVVANQIAATLKVRSVLDAFCGIGGSSIGFARAGISVVAVDLNSGRLDMAKHNASLYGVEGKIQFVCQDALQAMAEIPVQAVFLDPPWGGLGYGKKIPFTLSDFSPDGRMLLESAFTYFSLVVLRVPRQFDLSELKQLRRPFRVQDNYVRSRLYSKTVYFE